MTVPGRTQAYSAGNKVYGGGRSNPTSGPVDPTGYVERGMKKQSSDRRSGLASAAQRRLQGGAPVQPGADSGQQPVGNGTVRPQPSYASPIVLADGRRVQTSPTGQYEFIQEGL